MQLPSPLDDKQDMLPCLCGYRMTAALVDRTDSFDVLYAMQVPSLPVDSEDS